MIGGIGAVILLILCIAAAAIIFGTGLLNGDNEGESATETAVAVIQVTEAFEMIGTTEMPL